MSLAQQYQEMVDDQAPDWSDLFFELELVDEIRLDEARLAMAPAQLERIPGSASRFTFHVSHTRGYGAHTDLTRSCLAKLDERMIGGHLTLERVMHGVHPNWTQGPAG